MDIYESFRILEVSTNASVEEINKAFKKLAKKFHPDANIGNYDWAHQKMTEINQAYQLIVEYKKTGRLPNNSTSTNKGPTLSEFLKDLFKKDNFRFNTKNNFNDNAATGDSRKDFTSNNSENRQSYYHDHASYEKLKEAAEKRQYLISKISHTFRQKKDVIDEGMFVYYQYKLFKHPLRREGIGRLKFGDSKRLIKRGINEIEKLYQSCPLDDMKEEIKFYLNFIEEFLKSINCQEYIKSYNDKSNVLAFRYYRSGSDRLDEAFAYIFFKSKSQNNYFAEVNVGNLLSLAMQDFIRVAEDFRASDFAKDAGIKANLLEMFYSLYVKKYFK